FPHRYNYFVPTFKVEIIPLKPKRNALSPMLNMVYSFYYLDAASLLALQTATSKENDVKENEFRDDFLALSQKARNEIAKTNSPYLFTVHK
ncbi:hypothetical protein WA026_018597, partial [Henosepilachna vigintioctopunctata]